LQERLAQIPADSQEETVIYDGSVRDLCPLAPNNVNTMACAAMAGRLHLCARAAVFAPFF
jgi:predicted dinucleotide-utilizing enzyme